MELPGKPKTPAPLSIAPTSTKKNASLHRRASIPGFGDVFFKGELFEVYSYRAGTAAMFWCWIVSFGLDIWGIVSEDRDQWSPRNIAAQTFSLVVILDTGVRLIFKTSILAFIASKYLKKHRLHFLPNIIIRLQGVWFVSLNIVAAVARRFDMWILATCMTGLQWSSALTYAWLYFCPICFFYGMLLRSQKIKLDENLMSRLEDMNQERCKFTSIGPNLALTEIPSKKKPTTTQPSSDSSEESKDSAKDCPSTPSSVPPLVLAAPVASDSGETPRTVSTDEKTAVGDASV